MPDATFATTPIYYVNAAPHLGHAYTTIAVDVLTRHTRRSGSPTFFLTGTDEHGDKISRAAAAAGVEPKAWADRISVPFRELAAAVGAEPDFFIRTTDPEHEAFVQRFVERLRDAGDIYEGTYRGLYCTSCEEFYREADAVEGHRCPIHGIELEWLEEANWFFRLSAYQDRLLALYDERPEYVLPQTRMNETRSFVTQGLEDISISRASSDWGVPIPWQPTQVIYVWIDALLNYASALTYARPGEDLTERFWPPRWHVLGKDILKFHAVIWPAMLMAAGYEPPQQLYIHGFLTVRDAKMGKSSGNAIDPQGVIDRYGADALRFYLLREVRFGQDGGVSPESVHDRYTGELANDLGNLVSRTCAMVGRYRQGTVPKTEPSPEIAEILRTATVEAARRLERFELSDALDAIWVAVRAMNRYVETSAPWLLAKDESRGSELDQVLYTLADGVRMLAILLWPYLPASAEAILVAVGAGPSTAWDEAEPGRLPAGARAEAIEPLFPRVQGLEGAVA